MAIYGNLPMAIYQWLMTRRFSRTAQ